MSIESPVQMNEWKTMCRSVLSVELHFARLSRVAPKEVSYPSPRITLMIIVLLEPRLSPVWSAKLILTFSATAEALFCSVARQPGRQTCQSDTVPDEPQKIRWPLLRWEIVTESAITAGMQHWLIILALSLLAKKLCNVCELGQGSSAL